jgi:hypothetical protein
VPWLGALDEAGVLELAVSGLTMVPDGEEGAVGPVGARIVLLADGKGYGRPVPWLGTTDVVTVTTTIPLEPAVGTTMELLADGKGYGSPVPWLGLLDELTSSGLTIVPDGAEGAVGPVGARIVLLADGKGYGSPVPWLGTIDVVTGTIISVGPAVGATMVLLKVGRGYGAPVPTGATTEPDGAPEPVGATMVPLPAGYGTEVGIVEALLTATEAAVEDAFSVVTVTVEVIVIVTSRVIVVVASGAGVVASPPLG